MISLRDQVSGAMLSAFCELTHLSKEFLCSSLYLSLSFIIIVRWLGRWVILILEKVKQEKQTYTVQWRQTSDSQTQSFKGIFSERAQVFSQSLIKMMA